MRILAIILICFFIFSSATGTILAEEEKRAAPRKIKWVKSKYGVRALIKLGKSQASMAKEVERDTRNYNKLKEVIASGELRKGEDAAKVRKTVGEPVIILSREDEELTKWVYKPGNVSFFSDEKVYLIFNKDDELIGWKVLQKAK